MERNGLRLWIFLLLVICSYMSAISQDTKSWLKYRFPHVNAENNLWVGTPAGLYQYHYDEDTWSIYGTHSGLSANDIRILRYDGEFMWVATSRGIAYGDIKLNKWISYTSANGLPSDSVLTIEFQEDYVWVGTDKGAARFDKLIQEWEVFTTEDGLPDSNVYDIVAEGDLVYFATARGLTEYDVNFEKWRYYGSENGIPSDTIRFIYPTTEYLWLFTDVGPCRFYKKLHTSLSFIQDPRLSYENIRDLVVENDMFWCATTGGVVIYDPGTNIWRNFQEEVNLPSRSVEAILLSGENQWFATAEGVAVMQTDTKSWRRYDQTHGLSHKRYEAIAVFMGRIFLFNSTTIDYFKPVENRWYVYPLQKMGKNPESRNFALSLDREKGSYLQLNKDIRFSLSGTRFRFQHQTTHEYRFDTGENELLTEDITRGDLKAQLTLPEGRTINGFYNNIDYDQILYGTRYKGNNDDLVQEVNWGDVRFEQGKNQLIRSLDVFGVSARLEAGPKTERYKRSLVSAAGWSGEKTSGFETEFFSGNLQEGRTTLWDIDYSKNVHFRIDTSGAPAPIDAGSETVYIDDGDPENNTKNTNHNFFIAGEMGDFDRKIPYVDYRIDYEENEIQFLEPVSDHATIAISYSTMGAVVKRILKLPGGASSVLENRYFLGGLEIIPHSFSMEIADTSGNRYSLESFGLDEDRDGRVDPRRIDYKNGLLTFPAERPFPSSVYDPVDPKSVYRLLAHFFSEITIMNLKHNHLLRGSEIVTVDGEILTRGEDYVLDYSSGSLLVIKEGILAEDSEIQVDYEYYRDSREKFNIAGLGIGPSDNVQVNIDYFAFDEDQEDLGTDRVQGYHVFSELKWKMKQLDFKLTPEFARSQGSGESGNSMHLRTDVSSEKIRLYSIYEKYDIDFQPLYAKKFQLGRLAEHIAAGATYYLSDFDISTTWRKQSTAPQTDGKRGTEENLSAKILFSKNFFPAVSLSALHRKLDAEDYESDKTTLKGDFEYLLPRPLLQRISLNSMRLYGVWRNSSEEKNRTATYTYDTKYLRIDLSPTDLVQFNAFIRNKSVGSSFDTTGSRDRLLTERQKLFVDLTVDRLKGLNMNMRYQGELLDYLPVSVERLHNLSIYRNLQSNMRIFPGQWVQGLRPFTFEFNYQPTWRGYLRNDNRERGALDKFWYTPADDFLVSSEDSQLRQIRGEWRPSALFWFYIGCDLYDITSRYRGSILETDILRINQKIEIRPSMNSLITLQYFRNLEEKIGYTRTTRDNPMIWIENRWSERLRTKVNLTYWYEKKEIGSVQEHVENFSPLLGFTFRIPQSGSNTLKAEVRNDLSLSIYRSNNDFFDIRSNSISNALAIDYFLASVLRLRFRIVTTYKDDVFSRDDLLSNLAELRLTAMF